MIQSVKRALVLPDIHFPLENDVLLAKIKYDLLSKNKYDYVIYLGDMVDFDMFSTFINDPKMKTSLRESIEKTRTFFAEMRKALPKARMIFKEGNHDVRLRKYLIRQAPELLELDELSLPYMFELAKNKIEYYSYGSRCTLNGLKITHGRKCSSLGGYTAHAERRQAGGLSGISGHVHRLAFVKHYDQVWLECGWLGSTDYERFEYLGDSLPDWNPGFVEGYEITFDNGEVVWDLKPVEVFGDNSFIVNGRIY